VVRLIAHGCVAPAVAPGVAACGQVLVRRRRDQRAAGRRIELAPQAVPRASSERGASGGRRGRNAVLPPGPAALPTSRRGRSRTEWR
jgi:hypothetical protein